MRRKLLDILRCPDCLGNFSFELYAGDTDSIFEGLLNCGCGASYPIVSGIPRILPDAYLDHPEFFSKYKSGVKKILNNTSQQAMQRFRKRYGSTKVSFGWQWTTYKSHDPVADKKIFSLRTLLSLADLKDKWVLDAGCGGGRYDYVCANAGAEVVAVDISNAVERCANTTKDMPNVHTVQTDIENLPLKQGHFDYIYSIGVLSNTRNSAYSFDRLAPFLKKDGKISIWVYRKNTTWQELINKFTRGLAGRLSQQQLIYICSLAMIVGGMPLIKHLSKILNFSTHPDPEVRLRDNYDWYSPQYQWHHTEQEVRGWFANNGFYNVRLFLQRYKNPLYDWAYRHNLVIGSGIGAQGTKG